MSDEPQWLTLSQISLHSPQPPAHYVEAAAKDIPLILADVKAKADQPVSLSGVRLRNRLRNLQHTSSAADHAIIKMLASGLLKAMPHRDVWIDSKGHPILRRKTAREMADRAQAQDLGQYEPTKIAREAQLPIDKIELVAMDSLWHWWKTPAKTDAKSPLYEYASFLEYTRSKLTVGSRRDEEAILLLTDDAFRQRREQLISLKRKHAEDSQKIACHPRVWTRRDQRYLEFCAGNFSRLRTVPGGNVIAASSPQRRMERCLHKIVEQEKTRFTAALNETREDGLGSILAPKLEVAHQTFVALYDVCLSFTLGDKTAKNVADKAVNVGSAVLELVPYFKSPPKYQASQQTSDLVVSSYLPSEGIPLSKRTKTSGNGPKGKSSSVKHKQTDTEVKLIAALTQHHQYDNGSIGNATPIGCRQLGRKADVSEKSSSQFFKTHFNTHQQYKFVCNQPKKLIASLKALNFEFSPKDFYTARTPEEMEKEADTED